MENERMKAIKDILKESDRLLDLGDIEGHKEKLDELSTQGHLRYMINIITDQQATIDSLSMAHDAIHREMPKDKHTLIKNIIGLNKRVQELEEECIGWKEASRFNDDKLEQQNKRYRATINAMRQILKDAIHSLDVGEKVQGLEYGVKMANEALEGEEIE